MVLCAVLTSCYSEIEFDDLMPQPVPVINAIASPDTVVIASISRTYTENEDVTDLYLKDADVELTVNGSYSEKMQMVEFDTVDGFTHSPRHVVAYVSNYRPQPGDRIELSAATIYGEARSSDVVPSPVEIKGVEMDVVHNAYSHYSYDVTYHVKFHDPAGVKNYYLVNMSSSDYSYQNGVYLDYIDPLFEMQNQDITDIGSENSLRNGWGWTFSDETIDGLDYSLSLRETGVSLSGSGGGYYGESSNRTVRLYSVSENYYKYLRSVLKDEQRDESAIGDIGILEPVVIYSNIEGGTGIFGSACMEEMTFSITKPE